MKCIHCGKENPAGSMFCNYCGKMQKRFCSACNHNNNPELSFCEKCGKPLINVSEKKPPKKIYYDKTALYSKFCAVAEGDGITVFANGNGMFVADGSGNLLHRNEYPIAVALGENCIYGIHNDFESKNMLVKIYDRKFMPIEEKFLCKGDMNNSSTTFLFGTDGQLYCQLTYKKGLHNIESLTFTSVDLETFEKKEYSLNNISFELKTVTKIEDRVFVYNGKMYFKATLSNTYANGKKESSEHFYAFDFASGNVQIVPFAIKYGLPAFINFEKGIAWVVANKNAISEYNLTLTDSGKPPLLPVKIQNGEVSHMLKSWYAETDKLSFFDGTRAFSSPRPHILYGVNPSGNYSDDWISDSHGNGNMLYIHNNKIISELYADTKYYELPAKFNPPSDEDKVILSVTEL